MIKTTDKYILTKRQCFFNIIYKNLQLFWNIFIFSVILLIREGEYSMEVIIIDEREKYNASVSANAFADKNTRNRVYVNTLGAEIVLKYLVAENIDISNIHNINRIKKVLEEIDIADIMLPNIHIDVRVVYDENEIFIPKSHFEYNITPDIYIVIKPEKDYSRAEILGFFEPKLINKNNANKDYYFIEKEKLNAAEDFIQFIKNFKGNTRHNLSEGEISDCESIIMAFADHDISTGDKKHLLEQLVKSDDLRNKFIEFENFETLSYKAMSDSSIIKKEISEDNFDTEIFENEVLESDENDEDFGELESEEQIVEDVEENIEEINEEDTDNIDFNLLDGIENLGEVMTAGAAAVIGAENLADNAIADIAENVVSDTLETIGDIFENNDEEQEKEISESASFDELPEIENLNVDFEEPEQISEFAQEDETIEENVVEFPQETNFENNIETPQEEEILSDITEELIDEPDANEEAENILEELPFEEEIGEKRSSFGNNLIENLHAEEEESISIENLDFVEPIEEPIEEQRQESVTLEELPELETLEPLENLEQTENNTEISTEELPTLENPLEQAEEQVIENSIEEEIETDLPELDEIENLPEINTLYDNSDVIHEETIMEILPEEHLPEHIEEETDETQENSEIENQTEEVPPEELPTIESLTQEEPIETFEEISQPEEITYAEEENTTAKDLSKDETTTEKEDLFSSIDDILPDSTEMLPEENIEDIPDISALTSEIIPEDTIDNKIAEEKIIPEQPQTPSDEAFDISDMAFDDNSELEVLYSENEPEIKPEIPETIPGAAFLQQKQPINKKYLVTAGILAILAISALGFIKNKNNEIAEIPEIPQNAPSETLDENILEVNTPEITDEVKEVKQVEEIKKPAPQEMKNNIPVNKNPQAYVSVSKLVWDVPDELSYSKNIQNYLRTAGKSIKLSLSADLLLATEYAYTNQVKLSLKLSKDGNVQDAQIVSGSGSTQIDKIVLQSVKDTLNVVKPPANEVRTPDFNLNLIIYF